MKLRLGLLFQTDSDYVLNHYKNGVALGLEASEKFHHLEASNQIGAKHIKKLEKGKHEKVRKEIFYTLKVLGERARELVHLLKRGHSPPGKSSGLS